MKKKSFLFYKKIFITLLLFNTTTFIFSPTTSHPFPTTLVTQGGIGGINRGDA